MHRLTIVQNRPTQFDMPLYARMWESSDWDLQVIYSDMKETSYVDHELGHRPCWDHVPASGDLGYYLDAVERQDVAGVVNRIAAHEPELVILSGYYPRLHARLLHPLKQRGFAVGLRSDNTLPHGNFQGWKGVVKRLLLPFWLSRYSCWHPVGSLARDYLQTLSRKQRPVFAFPYAVDVDWFEQQATRLATERQGLRADLGLGSDDFVVLGIMKWHPREDPMTLLRAFARLREHQDDAKLVLIGDGPLRHTVEAAAAEIGAPVVLPGYQPYSKLPLFYAVSDVFVHPSVDEPWGVSVQEALACGLPVLVAEGVGARFDLLEDGVTGWTFANGDDGALLQRLVDLHDDDDLRQHIQSTAKARAHMMDYSATLANFSAAILEVQGRR